MNEKKLWNLVAVPSLAIISLLFAFLLLDRSKVEAAHNRPMAIPHNQSPGVNFTIPKMASTTNNIVAASNSDVCGNVLITETVDSAGDVGTYSSLALAPTSPTPYISYRDYITSENYNLKYAWRNGTTWFSETVDSGGEHTSLALAPTYPYSPFIVHDHYWEWDLKYACKNSTSWPKGIIVGGMRAHDGSLALEPTYPYTPHISYYLPWGTARTLFHAHLSGTTWCNGTWVTENVEPLLSEAGGWSSLALESTYPYTPHISYHASGDLKHAWLSGSTWLSETVDSTGDVGWNTSLALDSSGKPHISYVDNTNDSLKYAWLSGSTWLNETIDNIGEDIGYATRDTSLKLDQNDVPYVSYYDTSNRDLKLAHFAGTAWITQTVDSGGDVGRYNSLVLTQAGCPRISYYDSTNFDLKYAYFVWRIYLPIIMKNHS